MSDPNINVSDDSKVSIPIRNLISILGAVAVSTWAYSGVVGRLTDLETRALVKEEQIEQNTEFRIGWPRGLFGALPADAKQDMLIESLSRELADLKQDVEENESWINRFEPPPEVKEAISRLRDLEIKLSVLERSINK